MLDEKLILSREEALESGTGGEDKRMATKSASKA